MGATCLLRGQLVPGSLLGRAAKLKAAPGTSCTLGGGPLTARTMLNAMTPGLTCQHASSLDAPSHGPCHPITLPTAEQEHAVNTRPHSLLL